MDPKKTPELVTAPEVVDTREPVAPPPAAIAKGDGAALPTGPTVPTPPLDGGGAGSIPLVVATPGVSSFVDPGAVRTDMGPVATPAVDAPALPSPGMFGLPPVVVLAALAFLAYLVARKVG